MTDFSQGLSSWTPLLCSSLSSWLGSLWLWCRFWLPEPPMSNVLFHHSFNKYMHLLQCNAFDTFDMRTIEYLTIRTVYFDTSDIKYMYLPRYMHLLQCNAFDTFDMHTIEYLTIRTVYLDKSDIKYMYLPR